MSLMQEQRREAYEQIKREFAHIGYVGGLLQENYEFANILSPEYGVQRIALATFAQEPPSYRNACFGVTIADGQAGSPLVLNYRSLGAAQILEIRGSSVFRWKVTSRGDPQLIDNVPIDNISGWFQVNRDDWSPPRLLKAKSAGYTTGSQLDFLDLGLLPLLENEVRRKLDSLLRETVSLCIETFERKARFTHQLYPALFRLIFRLLAAKLMADRNHAGPWVSNDPRVIVRAVEDFYFRGTVPERPLSDFDTQLIAWERIRAAFHFQNLSVDSLAYVYENTLVSPETRKLFGIHSTPPAVAEYITRQLPFEALDLNERRVFEPFSGHAVFLVAAMQRLRELLPTQMTYEQRHNYFIQMLSGIEIDDFAREVARLSLMLADYPNPDGWRLFDGDALESPLVDQELNNARIVLCNPPFGDLSSNERVRYGQLSTAHKPAAILRKVLRKPPEMLGFVLPRVFLNGRGYRELRSILGDTYSSAELTALPDRVFRHSEAESVLLIAFGRNGGRVRLRSGEVYKRDLENFYLTHKLSYSSEETIDNASRVFGGSLWIPPLNELWIETGKMRRLGDQAVVHRGIEYRVPFHENTSQLVSSEPRPGFAPGLHRVEEAVEPYVIRKTVYLNVADELMRTRAHMFDWQHPKVIVNARRRTRGHWKITASPDYRGLMCYQNFHGVWPKDSMSIDVLAAFLNGPVANAFVASREGQRDIRVQTLTAIPIPDVRPEQEQTIGSLVREYAEVRYEWMSGKLPSMEAYQACDRLLKLIDAEVLKSYDLSPRLERALLDYFSGHARPGPVSFTEYFPATFKPYIPWHRYLSNEVDDAYVTATLSRLPILNDPLISDAMSNIT